MRVSNVEAHRLVGEQAVPYTETHALDLNLNPKPFSRMCAHCLHAHIEYIRTGRGGEQLGRGYTVIYTVIYGSRILSYTGRGGE